MIKAVRVSRIYEDYLDLECYSLHFCMTHVNVKFCVLLSFFGCARNSANDEKFSRPFVATKKNMHVFDVSLARSLARSFLSHFVFLNTQVSREFTHTNPLEPRGIKIKHLLFSFFNDLFVWIKSHLLYLRSITCVCATRLQVILSRYIRASAYMITLKQITRHLLFLRRFFTLIYI